MKNIVLLLCSLSISSAYCQNQKTDSALESLNHIKDSKVLSKKLKSLGAGSETDLQLLLQFYSTSRKSSDSIAEIALKRFPKGKIAQEILFHKVYEENDVEMQENLFKQLINEYPETDVEHLAQIMVVNFSRQRYSAKVPASLAYIQGNARPWALDEVLKVIFSSDLELAENLVRAEMSKPDNSKEVQLLLLKWQSQLLAKKGNFVEAYAALKDYYNQTTYKTPELNAHYYYLMSKTGGYREAFYELEKAVLQGEADEEIIQELTHAYAKLYPDKDPAVYLSDLGKKYENKYLQEMVNEPAPNFVVTDSSGKEVSLLDFKGKTIVLDFWATWCGPCKRGLPSMQMAVDKYKDDPDVKFLFIHTWEKMQDPTADARKYLSGNKFNLPLYMDLKAPGSKVNRAALAFKIRGIPAKYVIDSKGNIRFKLLSGFSGSDEAAVSELSTMIELARRHI
ncbi:TlpA family protein disulfide reductase [Sphingobacterium prati]|uniref:TlpA family protein disulfide reductase n=1 Tax=Sphingobacterium prati TaxID=2737006 RepID=UPI001555838F|nr:TlpA disulfide reductase family protein [Sphingobacterium prati]NPE47830.1 TlpA family protein disulfide reductase [Sphingobacterium prati]